MTRTIKHERTTADLATSPESSSADPARTPSPPNGPIHDVLLARYLTGEGRGRELVVLIRDGRPRVVLDRESGTHDDPRLIGELAPEETVENAVILGHDYLARPADKRQCAAYRPPACPVAEDRHGAHRQKAAADDESTGARHIDGDPQGMPSEVAPADASHARAEAMSEHAQVAHPQARATVAGREPAGVRRSDVAAEPTPRKALGAERSRANSAAEVAADGPPSSIRDRDGNTYRIARASRREHGTDLRWTRRSPDGADHTVTLKEVVGAMEDYAPAVAMTEQALGSHPDVAGSILRRELARLRSSKMVLNRKLREAVRAELSRGTRLSEIAARCGRTRKAAGGRRIGEGAWVARRVGLVRGGIPTAHRWIDFDVLGEIAQAIGLSPNDVRL